MLIVAFTLTSIPQFAVVTFAPVDTLLIVPAAVVSNANIELA